MNKLIQEFKESVSAHKEKLAVQHGSESISYAQLDTKSDALAYEILDIDADSKQSVALLLNHDYKVIIGMIAGLKAGRPYVPLDPSYPVERLGFCLEDSKANILLTSSDNLELAYKLINTIETDVAIVNIDACGEDADGFTFDTDQQETTYILYTSGSTGKPKGVIQDSNAIVKVAHYLREEFDITSKDNLVLTTSFSHTVSALDIYTTLLSGGTLFLYDVQNNFVRDEFLTYLKSNQITLLHTVPTFFRYLLKQEVDKSALDFVRLVMLGGERVSENDFLLYCKYFSDRCFFANLYGQSETLLGTINVLNKSSEPSEATSLGYPIDILTAYIISEGKEASVMNTGEIYLKADWLKGRYCNQFDENEELYIPDPINEEGLLLRTGDLGRWLPDGSIEYMGRSDRQYKISGNRVDINEIEKATETIEGVHRCVAVVSEGDALIRAYIRQQSGLSVEELKKSLRDKLPEYMMPSKLVFVDDFPLLPNGKVSYEDLLKIENQEGVAEQSGPSLELVEELSVIWKEVLEDDSITSTDNFFQLGGNSLHATEIVNKVYLKYQVEFELSIIFDNQSVEELAQTLEDHLTNEEYA